MASFWEKFWGNESRLGKWSLRRSNAQDDRSARVAGSSLLTRFLAWANNQFNPEHDWFDYSSMDNTFNSVKNQFTQGGLTGAQKASNQFSAEEAQKNRDWQEYMSNTSYQRAVKDMQAAGINPALAMSQGGASTPSGSSASSVSPSGSLSMSDLMQVLMMPLQKRLLRAQAQQASDQGEAALMQGQAALRNAGANERNAGSNERNAGVAEMNAETARMRQEVDAWLAKSNISVNDEQKSYLAEQTARLKIENQQLPERLEIAKRQVSAQEKQAIASLQSALAANRNAAVNENLQPLQAELYKAQAVVEWLNGEGKEIANRYLDERQRKELYNLEQEGIRLNKQGELIDKQGKLVTAQRWKTYVNCVTDASGAINQWVNPLSSGPGSKGLTYESVNASFSPMF